MYRSILEELTSLRLFYLPVLKHWILKYGNMSIDLSFRFTDLVTFLLVPSGQYLASLAFF